MHQQRHEMIIVVSNETRKSYEKYFLQLENLWKNIKRIQFQCSIFLISFKVPYAFIISSNYHLPLSIMFKIEWFIMKWKVPPIDHMMIDLVNFIRKDVNFKIMYIMSVRDMSQPHFHNSMSYAQLFPNHCNFQEILQLASQLQSKSCSERTYRSKSKMISLIWLPTLSNKFAF